MPALKKKHLPMEYYPGQSGCATGFCQGTGHAVLEHQPAWEHSMGSNEAPISTYFLVCSYAWRRLLFQLFLVRPSRLQVSP